MSVLKIVDGRNSELSQLTEIIKYVKNPEKNSHGLLAGIGVRINAAAEDMKTVKVLKNKITGRQYIHFLLSFDQGVDAVTAHRIGKRVLMYQAHNYFQILMAVHDNTANVHCHFVLNTVGKGTRKFSQSRAEMLKFRDYINRILEEERLNPIGAEQEEISFDCMDEEDTGFPRDPDEGVASAVFYASENCDFEDLYGYGDGYNKVAMGYNFTPDDVLNPDMESVNCDDELWLMPAIRKLSDEEIASPEGKKIEEKLRFEAEKAVREINAENALKSGDMFEPIWRAKDTNSYVPSANHMFNPMRHVRDAEDYNYGEKEFFSPMKHASDTEQ